MNAIATYVAELEPVAQLDLPSAQRTRELVPNLVVDSQKSADYAGELLKAIKGEYNRVEARKKEITGPLWNAHRSAVGLFAPTLKFLSEAEQIVKDKIATYTKQVRFERLAAMTAGTAASAPVEVDGVTVRDVRKWRVVDPDRVPRQFCSPDPAKIQAHVDAGGLEAIAGVEFYDASVTSVRVK